MSVFEKLKEKAREATQQFFESEEEMEAQVETEAISELKLPEAIVNEDIQQMANEILQEAVTELDQAQTTIYAVKPCIETLGQDSEAAIITKMLIKVANQDPKVLKEDGENRLKQIEKVVNDIKASSQKALEEVNDREKEIREKENESESSYTLDVSELSRKCEEDIMNLRLKLQADTKAREEQRDAELENMKQQREENKAERAKIEALSRAVKETAVKQQEEIKLYLSKLQVEA